MSTFKPNTPMPTELINIRTRVLKTSGLHLRFPHGIILPATTGGLFQQVLPIPLYPGHTVRGFFYAPEASSLEAEFLIHHKGNTYEYYAKAFVQGTKVAFRYSGRGEYDDYLTGSTTADLNLPGYYSLAVRMKDEKNLSLLVDDKELGFVDEEHLLDKQWELRMEGGVHFLLSLHFSSDTDDTPRKFGQQYYLDKIPFGVGSYWIIEAFVEDVTKGLTVYLNKGPGKQNLEASVPISNVAQGNVVTLYIRSTRGGYLLGASFTHTTVILAGTYRGDHYIRPSLSDNCKIHRQYAEQGTKRYF